MSRTANWIHSTQPGVAPPPPTVRAYSPAPSSISPHSSVSNPDASRYHRARSQSISSPPYHTHVSRQSRSPSQYSQNRAPPSRAYTTGSARHSQLSPVRPASVSGTRFSGSARGTYIQADKSLPVVARTTNSEGRTSSWVIIPPEGQNVEVVSPQRPATSMGHYAYTSPVSSPARSNSSGSQRNLLRRVFDKVEWGNKSTTSSRHTRRNSTGGSHTGSWTVVSGGGAPARSGVSVSTVRAGRRTVDIIRV